LTVLTNVTLASSNSTLPDDGDYTKTCWSCFNVNVNTPYKTCASVGAKTLILWDVTKVFSSTIRVKVKIQVLYSSEMLVPTYQTMIYCYNDKDPQCNYHSGSQNHMHTFSNLQLL